MKQLLKTLTIVGMLFGVSNANAEETLKMATIAPSLGQAITMATFANIVSKELKDVNIEIVAGGAATLHQLEVGRGNLDMSMTSPGIYNFMADGRIMYTKEADAPKAAKNVRLLMWFPYGQYHFAVRDKSNIKTLDDIEGATVFLGPQGGGAYNTARRWIEATTGLEAGKDYDAIKANWTTGFQSFLDGKIDIYTNGCLDPCPQFIQITETEKIRFLEPESTKGAAVDKFLATSCAFCYITNIPKGQYKKQTNKKNVVSVNTAVGIAISAKISDDTVYDITKAFWSNLNKITSDAPWAKALDIKFAAEQRGQLQLHPGAARYYKEVGAIN